MAEWKTVPAKRSSRGTWGTEGSLSPPGAATRMSAVIGPREVCSLQCDASDIQVSEGRSGAVTGAQPVLTGAARSSQTPSTGPSAERPPITAIPPPNGTAAVSARARGRCPETWKRGSPGAHERMRSEG